MSESGGSGLNVALSPAAFSLLKRLIRERDLVYRGMGLGGFDLKIDGVEAEVLAVYIDCLTRCRPEMLARAVAIRDAKKACLNQDFLSATRYRI